ncbi:hypothetical protein ABLN87_17970 [Ruegeria sp. SCPT10]|uniref:hypothetical protein n=1 Tax=Ruegeria sp. SCP10 TaxID=3141377 RepID=UPI003337A9F7
MKRNLFLMVTVVTAATAISSKAEESAIQSNFPPILMQDAPQEGAHPLGGPTLRFIMTANGALAHTDRRLQYHVSGEVPKTDTKYVEGPVADISEFGNIHGAVAAGAKRGGLDLGVGIANQNGLSFGELFVAGLPFGLEPDEYVSYLFDGGGLELQQELYDKHFDDRVLVMPIAITPTQGGGWFPEALPDPAVDPTLTPNAAMAELCMKPWIVRWPEPGAGIWRYACESIGLEADEIGASARCKRPGTICPSSENPVVSDVNRLTFGGFVPGVPPHVFVETGNVDAYELNLPSTEVLMIRLATEQTDLGNNDADLRSIIEAAPYYYGQTWHQPVTYIELLINKEFWATLSPAEQWAIRIAAESSTLRSWTAALDRQGEAIETLKRSGAKVGRWPDALLGVLRRATGRFLERKALSLQRNGDPDYLRVLQHMRVYQHKQRIFSDFGDINQGRAALPTTPN